MQDQVQHSGNRLHSTDGLSIGDLDRGVIITIRALMRLLTESRRWIVLVLVLFMMQASVVTAREKPCMPSLLVAAKDASLKEADTLICLSCRQLLPSHFWLTARGAVCWDGRKEVLGELSAFTLDVVHAGPC